MIKDEMHKNTNGWKWNMIGEDWDKNIQLRKNRNDNIHLMFQLCDSDRQYHDDQFRRLLPALCNMCDTQREI